jgi:hypothetical protein
MGPLRTQKGAETGGEQSPWNGILIAFVGSVGGKKRERAATIWPLDGTGGRKVKGRQ